jgi:thiol-disulfide isomerase/thioredoxin
MGWVDPALPEARISVGQRGNLAGSPAGPNDGARTGVSPEVQTLWTDSHYATAAAFMSRRRERAMTLAFAAGLALAGCGGSASGGGQTQAPDYDAALRDAPAKLAAVYDQQNQLLDGGLDAFERRVGSLRGHPVVVNNWAEWCGPCRLEFPIFQRVSARDGDRVAFLGVDSNDSADAAKGFLDEYPVPYPSFSDPDWNISDQALPGTRGLPKTAFYDSSGRRVYVHIGPYASDQDLEADIDRYAQ